MIEFSRVGKRFQTVSGPKIILRDASFVFPEGHNIGVLGGNGAGKSTLIRLISGAEMPDRGDIRRHRRVSFPLGFTGTFHPDLSGRQNARFLARLYGQPENELAEFVADFAELGGYYDEPVRFYSSGMLARFAFGVSFAIEFDVYLIDEITEVGDASFRRKCAMMFREKLLHSDIIIVSHNTHTIRSYCDMGAVLHDGALTFYDSVEDAMKVYRSLIADDA
jgi:capsular polysaccharide transport system ATP-binding protein